MVLELAQASEPKPHDSSGAEQLKALADQAATNLTNAGNTLSTSAAAPDIQPAGDWLSRAGSQLQQVFNLVAGSWTKLT